MLNRSPRKLRPRFLPMQIAGTSNDDPMPRAQIDGAPIFLSSSSSLCRSAPPPPRFLTLLPSLLALARFFFLWCSGYSFEVRAGASIRMQSESYHFTERISSHGSSSARSALLSRVREERQGEACGKSSCRCALKRDGEFPLILKQSRHNKLASRDSK